MMPLIDLSIVLLLNFHLTRVILTDIPNLGQDKPRLFLNGGKVHIAFYNLKHTSSSILFLVG